MANSGLRKLNYSTKVNLTFFFFFCFVKNHFVEVGMEEHIELLIQGKKNVFFLHPLNLNRRM